MIGIILLVASWAMLRLQQRPLAEIGFNHPGQRTLEFGIGFSVAAMFATAQYVLIAWFAGFSWSVNPDLGTGLVLESLRWNINSVLFEELVFRGYLLYKAIEWLGTRRACLLSAATFGVYHWFSYGILGAWVPMVYVFLLTGSFGLMFAYAFARTRSVFLPIALHLGWNIVTIMVFSSGPLGAQWLIADTAQAQSLSGPEQILTNLIIPAGLVVLVILTLRRRHTPEQG